MFSSARVIVWCRTSTVIREKQCRNFSTSSALARVDYHSVAANGVGNTVYICLHLQGQPFPRSSVHPKRLLPRQPSMAHKCTSQRTPASSSFPSPDRPPQVVSVWELAVGEGGRAVKGLTAQEVNDVAGAMGALRDWNRIIGLLGVDSSPTRENLPALNRRR